MEPRARLAEALRGRRVLVVERDPAAPDSLSRQLAALDVTAETAASGPEALLRVAHAGEAGTFALIVIGADLPGMGASGLTRALRGRRETSALPLLTHPRGPIDLPALLGALEGVSARLDLVAPSARPGGARPRPPRPGGGRASRRPGPRGRRRGRRGSAPRGPRPRGRGRQPGRHRTASRGEGPRARGPRRRRGARAGAGRGGPRGARHC